MIGLGAYTRSHVTKLGEDVIPPAGVNLVIASGSLIALVAFIGCCGAYRQGKGIWRFALIMYSLFLLVVIVIQAVAAMVLLAWAGKLDQLKGGANSTVVQEWERNFDKAVNQTFLECCSTPAANATDPDAAVCQVIQPVITTEVCGNFTLFKDGLIDFVTRRIRPVAITAVVLAVIQFLCFISACVVMCSKPKEEREEYNTQYGSHYRRYVG